MEIEFSEKTIKLEKELNEIDMFTIDSARFLEKYFDYVIISEYLSILFGKPRGTEDIDVFIKKTDFENFRKFYEGLNENGFEILNSESAEDAFDMLQRNIAIRMSRKGEFIPNIEMKFPKDEWGAKAIKKKIKIILNDSRIFVSPIEQNIAFKLYLGSRKDIDDACHLYLLFKKLNHLDADELVKLCTELGVSSKELERCKKYE